MRFVYIIYIFNVITVVVFVEAVALNEICYSSPFLCIYVYCICFYALLCVCVLCA